MAASKTNGDGNSTYPASCSCAIILAFLSICYMAGPTVGAGNLEYNNANIALKEILAFLAH